MWSFPHHLRLQLDTGVLSAPLHSSKIGGVAIYSSILACRFHKYSCISHIPSASIASSDGEKYQTSSIMHRPYYLWDSFLSDGENPPTSSSFPQWAPYFRSRTISPSVPLPCRALSYLAPSPLSYPAPSTPSSTASLNLPGFDTGPHNRYFYKVIVRPM